MPKDTKSSGYNKAPACESRGFGHKKEGANFDTPSFRMAIEPQRLHSSFFDSCFLTGKSTQVIQFSATYFTILVNRDAFDKRRFDRENTFYTYVFRHLTHCEAFFVTMT